MKYDTKELGEYIEILSGFAFKSKDFTASGVPVIKIKNICPPDVLLNDVSYVSKNFLETHGKYVLNINDILIAMTGSHINQWASVVGRVARVRYQEKSLLNQRVGKIVITDTERCDENFVYYYLSQDFVKIKLANIAGGAANQANISPSDIKRLQCPFPDINTQRRIGKILSSYDDLIENNQKQIKLLEEAAQRLYREWFVDLKFPGYEAVNIVDGIPDGWRKILLEDIIEYEIGGGWGEENITEQYEYPAYVIRGTDFYGVTHGKIKSVPYRAHKKSNLLARTIVDGDIIFEVSGGSKTEGVAKTVLIRQCLLDYYNAPVMCASFCKLVRAKCIEYSQILFDTFQYLRLSGKTAEFDKKSASSIVNYRWKDFLMQQEILVPSREILVNYNSISENLYFSILNCSMLIEKAEQARDYLLPKLMSGEIRI